VKYFIQVTFREFKTDT